MREFHSIGAFVAHLAAMEAAAILEAHKGLKECAVAVERTAKTEIGTYQGEVGSFAAWAPLTDATQSERVRLGYTADDPLLRTGELRDSISHEISGLEACIGSNSDVMVFQELGTEKIPPRAVMGPAGIHNVHKIMKVLGAAVAKGLLYGSGDSLTPLE